MPDLSYFPYLRFKVYAIVFFVGAVASAVQAHFSDAVYWYQALVPAGLGLICWWSARHYINELSNALMHSVSEEWLQKTDINQTAFKEMADDKAREEAERNSDPRFMTIRERFERPRSGVERIAFLVTEASIFGCAAVVLVWAIFSVPEALQVILLLLALAVPGILAVRYRIHQDWAIALVRWTKELLEAMRENDAIRLEVLRQGSANGENELEAAHQHITSLVQSGVNPDHVDFEVQLSPRK